MHLKVSHCKLQILGLTRLEGQFFKTRIRPSLNREAWPRPGLQKLRLVLPLVLGSKRKSRNEIKEGKRYWTGVNILERKLRTGKKEKSESLSDERTESLGKEVCR